MEKSYVYKITNKMTGKYYIGVHTTKNIDDGYFGSSKLLNKDLKHFGLINFNKEILKEFDDPRDAYNYEKEIVNSEFIKRCEVYNEHVGGSGNINKNDRKQYYFVFRPTIFSKDYEILVSKINETKLEFIKWIKNYIVLTHVDKTYIEKKSIFKYISKIDNFESMKKIGIYYHIKSKILLRYPRYFLYSFTKNEMFVSKRNQKIDECINQFRLDDICIFDLYGKDDLSDVYESKAIEITEVDLIEEPKNA